MTARTDARSALSVLGFTAAEEDAYRTLLRRSPVPRDTLPDLLRVGPQALEDLLSRLTGTRLVEVRDGVVTAVPPARALQRAISAEHRRLAGVREQLDVLREAIPGLAAEHRGSYASSSEPVDLRVVAPSGVTDELERLAELDDGELLWLRPDHWRLAEGRWSDQWVEDQLREGRRSRALYPARAMQEAPEVVRRRAELGERVRLLNEIPGRLVVIGDTAAMLPRHVDLADITALVVEQPALLALVKMWFEELWARAITVPGMGARGTEAPGASGVAGADIVRRLLLDELMRGSRDEQIAHTLGVSLRTARRRVAELLEDLEVSSRFQAGAEAVRRGWL